MRLLLPLQLLTTLAMFGLIWFVQVAHYPLLLQIGAQEFSTYEAANTNRTTYVVLPLMVGEFATAIFLLLPRWRPVSISATEAWLGAALVVVIWLSTALLQVPLHNRLNAGYSAQLIHKLVATNWIRTAAWTARAMLVLRWAYLAQLV